MAKSKDAVKKLPKKSLRERMMEKKKKLAEKGGGGFILRQKDEGTIRIRILPTGDDFSHEITTFYLDGIGGCNSPATFGEPCALTDAYNELKSSSDDSDKELAKGLVPRQKVVIPIIWYKDQKGKEVDEENSMRLLQIAGGVAQDLIDLYLDEDEWGDMTDPENGYDIKITRTGMGRLDTSYSVMACKNTPLPKKYRKTVVDLEDMVRKQIDSYEKTVELRDKFLGIDGDDDDEDYKPKSKKAKKDAVKSKAKGKTSKKKKSRDI